MDSAVIYPGTFDPLTYGHIDITQRASRLFNRVLVAVADSQAKQPLFTINERVQMIRAEFSGNPNIEVHGFDGLLLNFIQKHNARVVLRGLRAVSDFEYEFQLASMNRQMDSNLESVFLMPGDKFAFVSSSLVKEIAQLGGDISHFVPERIRAAMTQKLQGGKKWH